MKKRTKTMRRTSTQKTATPTAIPTMAPVDKPEEVDEVAFAALVCAGEVFAAPTAATLPPGDGVSVGVVAADVASVDGVAVGDARTHR